MPQAQIEVGKKEESLLAQMVPKVRKEMRNELNDNQRFVFAALQKAVKDHFDGPILREAKA